MSVFDAWMQHRCTVNTVGETDEFGGSTHTTHADVPCRIEDGTKVVITSDGLEIVSTSQVHAGVETASWFTPGSEVLIAGREPAEVASADVFTEEPALAGVTAYLR